MEEDYSKTVFSRYDREEEQVNLQRLWQHTEHLHKIKSNKIPTWMREGLIWYFSYTKIGSKPKNICFISSNNLKLFWLKTQNWSNWRPWLIHNVTNNSICYNLFATEIINSLKFSSYVYHNILCNITVYCLTNYDYLPFVDY